MGTVSKIRGRPGPPPGTHHAGTFKPGYDERRWVHGPNPVKLEFNVKIKESAEAAVRVLDDILGNPDAPIKEKRQAAELVLSHAYGNPVSRLLMAEVGGGEARAMPKDQLMKRVTALLERDDIDAEYSEVPDV